LSSRAFLTRVYSWLKPEAIGGKDGDVLQKAIDHFRETQQTLPDQELHALGLSRKTIEEWRDLSPLEINKRVEEAADLTRRYEGLLYLRGSGQNAWTGGNYYDVAQQLRAIECIGKEGINQPLLFGENFDYITADKFGKRILTPWPSLNKIIRGWQSGELYLFAGEPKAGKTTLMINIAAYAAKIGENVLFITLEFKKEEVGARLASHIARIDLTVLPDHIESLKDSLVANIKKSWKGNLWIEDLTGGSATLNTVEMCIQRQYDQGTSPGLVIVDYGDKINSGIKDEVPHIRYVFDELFKLAQRQNVPMLSPRQINTGAVRALRSGEISQIDGSAARGGVSAIADASCTFTLYQTDKDIHCYPQMANLFISHSRICRDQEVVRLIRERDKFYFGEPNQPREPITTKELEDRSKEDDRATDWSY